jgi:hypothetical protein
MKKPSRSIAKSIAKQRVGGRTPESVQVERISGTIRRESMIAPGEGGVVSPPGAHKVYGNSAVDFADAVGGKFGGGRT